MNFRAIPFCLPFVLLAGWAYPCPCGGEKDPVKVTLVVILAKDDGSAVDPRLKAIAEEIRKLNPSLKSFSLKSMQSKSIKPGERVSLPTVDNKKVDLVIRHGADTDNRVGISVFPPNMGEIEYRASCGKFLPIVTRYETDAKERLILAIRVQPCRGD